MTILSYKDSEGNAHWPDAQIGSEKFYAVDWDDFLTAENDTITSISWTVTTGLTNMTESQVLNQVRVKLSADAIGDHVVLCEIETIEGGETSKFIQKMNLEVV